MEFTLRKFGKSATVIFNETGSVPSIFDDNFLKSKKGACGSEISFIGATPLKTKKQEFLSNVKNRNAFIRFLSQKLEEAGCMVLSTIEDVNVFIAQTAVSMSYTKTTVVIGEEANLLVLMCFYANAENCQLYLRSYKKHKAKSARLWNITETHLLLGEDNLRHLLFVNAFGGCQSTSHIFGIGEGVIFSKLNDKHFAGKKSFRSFIIYHVND